jgi:hypothetical protein
MDAVVSCFKVHNVICLKALREITQASVRVASNLGEI